MPPVPKPVPDGYRTLTPHLVVRNAAEAIEFYKQAFAAEVVKRMPGPDGRSVLHAELRIGDSMLMLCDELPQMERWVAPPSLGGTTVGIFLYVADVDAVIDRAVRAGATVSLPVQDMFWGDRYGKITDPFGHEWAVATHVHDMTPEEIQQGAKEFFAQIGHP